MKLVSKKEPVKPVAPYVWGAKYLVLDSVPNMRAFDGERGDIVIATKVSLTGAFKVNTEKDYGYIHPEHLQLIDPAPQPEHVPVTVDTAVIGKQYVLNAGGCSVPQGEIVTLVAVNTSFKTICHFRVTKDKYVMDLRAHELEELPVETSSETVYTVELTESELQGIVVGVDNSTYGDRKNSAIRLGYSVEVEGVTKEVLRGILAILGGTNNVKSRNLSNPTSNRCKRLSRKS